VLFVSKYHGEKELREAAAGLIASGDPESAAVAEVMLAEIAWHETRRADCDRHIEHAAALVADSPPSFAKTKVLAGLARSYMLADRSEDAVRVGSEVLALAESLGLDELRAMALSHVGIARIRLGDLTGLDQAREAVEIAREVNSFHLSRWVSNVAGILAQLGRSREAFALWDEAEEIARRDGAFATGRFIRGLQSRNRLAVGRWDEALELADAFLAEAQDAPHYLEGGNYHARSVVRLGRDDPEGAREDADLGLEAARRARDPQALGPLLVYHAAVLAELGVLETADAEADEILEMCADGSVPPLLPYELVVLVFEGLGRGEDLHRVRECMNPGPWRDALDLHLAGDPAGAADLAEEIGVPVAAAWWRLLAGRMLAEGGRHAEADVELEKALAFFRSVGAPRFVRQTESLLSATA
jgi:tetratricopeptide (TPR) repeat protein